ncbi:GCG_CRPN prefix-to-repeats domain-containing protein [Bradyrhizobium sp. SZCCHNS2022]|uniref:GCG_CRPN prefix-to-repeats domain-containing protein n=1 Tax=unclassified Bradyrhizobium TaxID=2631580 RepID=UPI00396578AE
MRLVVLAVLTTGLAAGTGASAASESCGPGCHVAPNGGCVVNGWEQGAPVWNECPAGARPRPPCGAAFRWSRPARACVSK